MPTNGHRAELVQVIANLRHAYAQPNLDRGIADGLIAPEIRRLEAFLDDFDAHDRDFARLIAQLKVRRAQDDKRVDQLVQALTRIAAVLAPVAGDVEAAPHLRGAIALALDQVRAAGIDVPDP